MLTIFFHENKKKGKKLNHESIKSHAERITNWNSFFTFMYLHYQERLNIFSSILENYLNGWIASRGGDTTVIFLITSHFYVSFVSPGLSPAVFD